MIHCKLYHFLYQKYSLLDITSLERVSHNIREASCTYVSLCPSLFLLGQAALKFSLLQQLLINFTFLTTNHLPGPLILRQVFGGKFYLSWSMTGQQLFRGLAVGHSQDLLVNKLKYSAFSYILCLTELLAIVKGSILLLFSYLFC